MPDCDDIDVRLLGLLLVGGSLVGVSLMGGSLEGLETPNDRRLTPDTYALEMAEPADTCELRFLPLLSVTVSGT